MLSYYFGKSCFSRSCLWLKCLILQSVILKHASAILEQLKRMRSPPSNKKPERRKQVAVEPGKSVSVEDLNPGNEHDEPDNSGSEVTESEVTDSEDYDSENSFHESDKSKNDEELSIQKSPLMYTYTTVGQWVKVLYEGEVFIGKILRKTAGETNWCSALKNRLV